MEALLTAVKTAVFEIITGSGFGSVTIDCAAGKPKEIRIDKSLRFERDICTSPEAMVPEAFTS